MTCKEALELRPGDVVELSWPGSNSGAESKRAMVRVVNRLGAKVGVNVARTHPGGRYTGDYGRSVRWVDSASILEVIL